jgi:hypothetical protein
MHFQHLVDPSYVLQNREDIRRNVVDVEGIKVDVANLVIQAVD